MFKFIGKRGFRLGLLVALMCGLAATFLEFSGNVSSQSRKMTTDDGKSALAAGTLTVKMGSSQAGVATPSGTFTLRRRIFTGSTTCASGGGAFVDTTGIDAITGTPISLTALDSVLLDVPTTNDRNGQWNGGYLNPDGLSLNFLPGNKVCVAGFDNVTKTISPTFGAGVETFAFSGGCTTTPKYLFNVGETFCYRVSGSAGTVAVPWGLSISGGQNNSCNLFFPVQQITAETVTGSVVMPASNGAVPGGCAGNPTTDVRGPWSADLRDQGNGGGNFKGQRQFRLQNVASPLASLSLNANLNTPNGGYPTASGAGSPPAQIRYQVSISNSGPNAAASTNLVTSVPSGTTFVSYTQMSGTPFNCGAPAGGFVTCTLASMPPGSFASFELLVSYLNKPGGTDITSTSTVTTSTSELNTADNNSALTATVSSNTNIGQLFCRPDITVNSTSASGAIVNFPGAPPLFTETLPHTGGTFAPSPPSGSLFPIGTNFVTINAIQDGSCSFRVIVIDAQRSNLTINKTHAGNFAQGQVGAQFLLSVKNIGGISTSGTVTVVESPPAGMTITNMAGTGWTCNVGTLTCTRSDALAPNTPYPFITVTANIAPYLTNNGNGSTTNTATVSGGGDGTPDNNQTVDTPIIDPLGTGTPTAAGVSVSGRVTTAEGRGIRGAIVTLRDENGANPINVTTGPLGTFTFSDIEPGHTYILSIRSRRFTFANPTRVINLNDNVNDADFVSESATTTRGGSER